MGEAADVEQLAAYLRALGLPNRIELLRRIQLPRTSREIEILPVRKDAGMDMGRALSRQTVEEHLAKLHELGLVQARAATREGRRVTEYVVNHSRLFVIVDELKRLTLLQPVSALRAPTLVADAPDGAPTAHAARPRVMLANGPQEGRTVALGGSGPWTIGRAPEADVCLRYDPFLSREHARLARTGTAYALETLGRANLRVNGAPVQAGERASVQAGDLFEMGRTLLVLQP